MTEYKSVINGAYNGLDSGELYITRISMGKQK